MFMLRRPGTGVTGFDGAVVRRSRRKAPYPQVEPQAQEIPPLQQHPAAGPAGMKNTFVMTDTARALSPDPAETLQAAARRRVSPTTRFALRPAPRRAAERCGPLGEYNAQAHAYRFQSPGGDAGRRPRR